MILIIGGMGQGKLDYVLKKTGLNMDDVATSLFLGWKKPVLIGLQDCIHDLIQQKEEVRPHLELLLQHNPEIIVICDEIGSGVVPMAAQDREWREAVGRSCCFLAQKAQRVERIFCGLPMILKEDAPWKSC